jgi:hypothetical protein
MNDSYKELAEAARLLVDIAGPEPVHIEMSARGPKTYYDVHRALCERDGRAHLLGWKTKGATLRHPDGKTRALCYDADTPGDWHRLQEAVHKLAESGYSPFLEASPVGRGGHLWIIYNGLVDAVWARRHAEQCAPMLQEIAESWPGAVPSSHKVRLPGGKYVQPGVCQWCMLVDARGTSLTRDGQGAPHVLLDWQTPAMLVPAYAPDPVTVEHEVVKGSESNARTQAHHLQHKLGKVDTRWREKYGRSLWFQFTPAQLSALYNEQHPLQDMLKLELNGMAFSPSVQERTPSTAITKDGRVWVDFSACARQGDGKHDGGDALELAARRNGETKTNKRGTMQEAARTLVCEAKAALEEAAREGRAPPSWVASIMTKAGWQHYQRLRDAVRQETQATSIWGVTGFHQAMMSQAVQESVMPGAAQLPDSAHNSPYESSQAQDAPETLEALAADIGAEIGEPCSRCGCALSYQSGSYRMCHRCYPRPAKFGRLTDEQWQRLRALFPRNPVPPGN